MLPRQHCRAESRDLIKIVLLQPVPLEKLFGQIGKCFDAIFNQKGKQIERPYQEK